MKEVINVSVALLTLIVANVGNVNAAAVGDFADKDANPRSPRYGQNVGPYDAVNKGTITMWYYQSSQY